MSKSEMKRVNVQSGRPTDWKPTIVVEIEPDDGQWFCHSKELDYFAGGATVDACKQNFTDGLQLTMMMHRKLKPPHTCAICRVCKFGVLPNFDWKFVEGEPVT